MESRLSGLLQQPRQQETPSSRLSGLLTSEPVDRPQGADDPVKARQQAQETYDFAVSESLPIDAAENLYSEFKSWAPADPDDLPEYSLDLSLPPQEPRPMAFEAAPEPGFWKRLLTQGYDGYAKPEYYWQMNPIRRAAFDVHMAAQHYLHRIGGTAASELGLISKENAMNLYKDELRTNPRWYERGPEAAGWTAEKTAEYLALKGVFRITGLSNLLTKSGQTLAKPFVTAQLAGRGAQTVGTMSVQGLKKLGQDATVAFLKHAPENIAFLSAWSAGSAALKDEDIFDAAIAGSLWGLGFSALTPALGALGKAFLASPVGQRLQFAANRAYTHLWQNYPRLMNLGRKPFSDEFMAEAERQFRSRFGIEPTPADREALKKVTRMWGDAVTRQAEHDAAVRAYWESGKQAARQTTADAATQGVSGQPDGAIVKRQAVKAKTSQIPQTITAEPRNDTEANAVIRDIYERLSNGVNEGIDRFNLWSIGSNPNVSEPVRGLSKAIGNIMERAASGREQLTPDKLAAVTGLDEEYFNRIIYQETPSRSAQEQTQMQGQTEAMQGVPGHPGGAIVKTTAETAQTAHPGRLPYADFFRKYGEELAKPEGTSEWLKKHTLPGQAESPSELYRRLKNEAVMIEPENLPLLNKGPGAQVPPEQISGIMDNVSKSIKAVPKLVMNILEPSKAVERKFGGQVYADVLKGTFGHAEAKGLDFNEQQLKSVETDIQAMGEWFGQFSREDLRNLMMSRGNPIFEKAQIAKDQAYDKLPEALKTKKVRQAIQEIADFNYEYLTQVAGNDIEKVRHYFYGNYKNSAENIDAFLDMWYRTTERMTKEKKLPTVADAIEHGLELKSYNPVENLRQEFNAIARLEGMQWLRDTLLKNGQGAYIDNMMDAPADWVKIGNEPVFRDLRVQPDLARMINNLISTNKVSQNAVLRGIRHVNNFLRTLKFAGSTFHLMVEASQAVADNPMLNPFRKSTIAGLNKGFKKDDPAFRTPEYKEYVKLGGGHKYSIESEALSQFKAGLNTIMGPQVFGTLGKAVKGLANLPIPPLPGFAEWMFDTYIPRLKYIKYLDETHRQEMKLGRSLTEPEKIDIIKSGQNLFGEMNERLFGRSGTTTSVLRFIFLAPGFAEGNYRTIVKSVLQWGFGDGYNAQRERANIINSLVLKGIAASVGTLIMTGHLPEKPEKPEDIRDLWKIDTGQLDDKGRKVMIDTLTYDKDYANFLMNLITLRPDKFVLETFKRLGGMKAPLAEMAGDFFQIATGKALYDFKGDRVIEITDTFSQKLMKLVIHELEKTEPISVSTFRQAKNKDVDTALAFIQSVAGVRTTLTEEDIRKQQSLQRIYSLKGQQEELYQYLRTLKHPRQAIDNYNQAVERILNSDFVPREMSDEWRPKLMIDTQRLLKNKREDYASPAHTVLEAQRLREFLVNFGETPAGIWEGPETVKQALSDFTEARRVLLRKKESGSISLEETARLNMYEQVSGKLSKIAKQIETTSNDSARKSYFSLIETILETVNKK